MTIQWDRVENVRKENYLLCVNKINNFGFKFWFFHCKNTHVKVISRFICLREPNRQQVLLSWAPHPDGIGHICDGDGLSSHMGLIETKNNKTFPTGANGRLPDPPNLLLPPQTQPI